MTPHQEAISPGRERPSASRAHTRTRWLNGVGATAVAFAFVASLALAPPAPPSDGAVVAAYALDHAQDVDVATAAAAEHLTAQGAVTRDSYEATSGLESLVAGGTNVDWAKLVLLFAGYPITETNTTVINRWMRQENYVDSWWNRNNPLNNGWGASYGPGGTGSNVNLVEAARNAADALNTNKGYAGIRAAFLDGTSTTAVEQAIWASPWASGHYNGGTHWHYHAIEVVKAPASAWTG